MTAQFIDPSFGWRTRKTTSPVLYGVGTTTCSASNGSWSLDISGLKIGTVQGAVATVVASSNNISDQGYATLRSISNTTITGFVVVPNTLLLGGSGGAFATSAYTVYIQFWGK